MKEAAFKLAVIRSEKLLNFYQAERRAGVDAMTAHERMAEHAKYIDAEFERQQAAVTEQMERVA